MDTLSLNLYLFFKVSSVQDRTMAYKSELQTLSLLNQNFDDFKDYIAEIEDL